MGWRTIWHDTDKLIEADDAGNVRTTWANPHAVAPYIAALAATQATAHTDGAAWAQPLGAHDAYPLGATVTSGGKTWVSLTPANVWAPGVSGWREQVAQGYPTWVQPTGGHDAYKVGDRVTFEGADYESTIAGNVWSPTAYPAGWRKL